MRNRNICANEEGWEKSMLGDRRGKQLRDYVPSYVVYDLETTGTRPNMDAIVEISAVKVENHTLIDTFSMLVNPGCPIPYGATAINGITDEMVAQEPDIETVFPLFLEFIGDAVLVGHNIHCFDMKFIWRVAETLYEGKTVANDYIDTLPMARRILPDLAHHRLTDISVHYHISTEGAHRALNDCMMNRQCYELLAREQGLHAPRKCPRCGGELKRRNGRYGEFWGCMEYPSCKYTENI